MKSQEKKDALIEAVVVWAGENEGHPSNIADAELLKALWTYDGDRTQGCPECDGDCGEPCVPTTVAAAHGSLDEWIARRRRISALA